MKRTVHLYWQETCGPAVYTVAQALRAHFPVTIVLATAQEPTRQAFDTARGQYDALYLLRELSEQVVSGDSSNIKEPLVLWVIEEDISYADHDYLYGAVWHNFAVVSAARIGFGENLNKEACHEIGHLFGLAHCSNSCLMNTPQNRRQLAAKPMQLCSECSSKLGYNK